MKYRYTVASGAIDTRGRYTKRPVVEVELSAQGRSRKFLALIDSGADQVTMSAAIAEVLGIDRATCPRRSLMGVTMQRIEGFVAPLQIRVQHQTAAITAPVVFIDTDVPVLLGQEAFFDRYRIKFEKDHDTFEITPSRKS
jgi:hypothetical protein